MADKATYTDEQRAEACTLYVQHGAAGAADLCGIPAGTISVWAHRRGLTGLRREQNAAALEGFQEATEARWSVARFNLTNKFSDIAEALLESVQDRVEVGDLRNAKEGLIAAAICVDKANLLAGGTTSRVAIEVESHETVKNARARVMELMPGNRAAS